MKQITTKSPIQSGLKGHNFYINICLVVMSVETSSSSWQHGEESSRDKTSQTTCCNPREGGKIVWGLNIGCKEKLGNAREKFVSNCLFHGGFQKTQCTDAFANQEWGRDTSVSSLNKICGTSRGFCNLKYQIIYVKAPCLI